MQASFVFHYINVCLEELFQEWLRDCSEIYEMEFAKSLLCQFQVRPKYLGSSEEQDMDLSNIFWKNYEQSNLSQNCHYS